MRQEDYSLLKQHLAQNSAVYTAACDTFYQRAFSLLPELKEIFGDDPERRKRKYLSMLATVNHLKHFEQLRPAIHKMGARHVGYGAQKAHYKVVIQAFLEAIDDLADDHLLQAWRRVLEELAEEMCVATQAPPQDSPQLSADAANNGQGLSLAAQIGGTELIYAIHLDFYEKIFSHPWLGEFFYGKSQTALAKKQTAFMVACLGGDNSYQGETPATAHMHMYITREMLEQRESLLRDTILAHGVSAELADKWLQADRSFWSAIEKHSVDECVTKCPGQMPIVIKESPAPSP